METVHDPIRVLHIDDQTSVLEVTGRLLETKSDRLTVTSSPSTTAALERLEEADCIVADYLMPEMDGAELVARVHEARPDLPVVFFTGHDADDLAPEALEGTHTEHVRKGANVDQYETLGERIVTLVDTGRDPTNARVPEPTAES
jgi:CheY-like chemotaxis protein